MNRPVTAVALFAWLSALPAAAHAQTIEIGPEPAPSAPPSRPPGDVTIDITAAPPPSAPVVPRYAYPSNLPPGYGGYAPYGTYASYQPPPPTPDTPQDVARSWSRHLALGGTVGIGSPLGWLGVWVDANVSRWIGFTFGIGTGGNFGVAFDLGLNFRPVTFGRWALYFGSGFSMNVLDGRYNNNPSLSVPGTAWWWNLEGGFEYRARGGLLMRFAIGYTIMLNTGDFTNRDFGGFYGEPADPSIGFSPVSAADAHDNGEPLGFVQVHYDLGGLFNF